MKRIFKIGAASLAFVPMMLVFAAASFGSENDLNSKSVAGSVYSGCSIYYWPVFALMGTIETFQPGKAFWLALFFLGMTGWSSLIACVLWKMAAAVLGEEEPGGLRNNGRFDWVRFQVRFACGFVLGCLTGWRFVQSTNSFTTLVIPTLASGLVGGLIIGLSRPPDFWSRRF